MTVVGQVFIRSDKFHPVKSPKSIEDYADERRRAESFASSQEALAKLAERARANYLAGKTELLDPDTL